MSRTSRDTQTVTENNDSGLRVTRKADKLKNPVKVGQGILKSSVKFDDESLSSIKQVRKVRAPPATK